MTITFLLKNPNFLTDVISFQILDMLLFMQSDSNGTIRLTVFWTKPYVILSFLTLLVGINAVGFMNRSSPKALSIRPNSTVLQSSYNPLNLFQNLKEET